MAQIFNIPFSKRFAPTFAKWLVDSINSPEEMAKITVWLPSTRQIKAVKSAIEDEIMQKAGVAGFLPKMRHLGDDETVVVKDIPPPVDSLTRLMVVNKMIAARGDVISAQHKMAAAESLCGLFARLASHQIPLEKLNDLVPANLASHWQKNAEFLDIVATAWPAWCKDNDVSDPDVYAVAQNLQVAGEQAEGRVIAAGFSDTTPVGIKLLQNIKNNPQGVVIFQGIDVEIGNDLPPTHAQYGMKHILDKVGIDTNDIKSLSDDCAVSVREEIWRKAQQSPIKKYENGIDSGYELLEATTLQTEASAIALMMREVIEIKDKTCALITTDTQLARAVAAALLRWDIVVDDSNGVKFTQTTVGRLFNLLIMAVSSGFKATIVAEILQHPLTSFTADKNTQNTFKNKILRSQNLAKGLAGLKKEAQKQNADQEVKDFIIEFEQIFAPLRELERDANFDKRLNAHLNVFKNCTNLDESDESFKEIESFKNKWQELPEYLAQPNNVFEYIELIKLFTGEMTVRQPQTHPRLFIWGALEARLQKVDKIIIGEMNEGTWPRSGKTGEWLNFAMENQLGLPHFEMSKGLNFHDFLSLVVPDGEVVFARSLRNADGVTIRSRYLDRLEVAIGAKAFNKLKNKANKWLEIAEGVAREGEKISKIFPAIGCLPQNQVPKTWSPSFIKDLVSCPYKAYVKKAKKIGKFEEFEAQFSPLHKGNVIHEVLQAFFEQVGNYPPPYADEIIVQNRQSIIKHLTTLFEHGVSQIEDAMLKKIWWVRIENFVPMVADKIITDYAAGKKVIGNELEAKINFGAINLFARADRLDSSADGLVVVDYKTGNQLPSAKDVTLGKEPQMAVEALIAAKGGFGEAGQVAMPEFWHVTGKKGAEFAVRAASNAKDMDEFLQDTEEGLARLANHFTADGAEFEAVPNEKVHCKNCEYAGVCRFKEWVNNG